jgi:hypothetical protein
MAGAGAAGLVSALFWLYMVADNIKHTIKPDITSLFVMLLPISLLISLCLLLPCRIEMLIGYLDSSTL